VCVLVAAPWHERDSAVVAARSAAPVFAHAAGLDRVTCRPVRAVEDHDIVAGAEVLRVGGVDEGEVVVWLPAEKALVSAEVLTGTEAGLRIAESPALRSRSQLHEWLEQVAELPVDVVLLAHGPPVLRDGQNEIRAALARPPW
jgi:hypothetical protein